MVFTVIDNPDFKKFQSRSGFKNSEFKLLVGLFSRAVAQKALYDIAVDVDFDEGVCTFTYYRSSCYAPAFQFVIRRVGPRTDMYEVYREGRGRIIKSGIFDRAYKKLEEEIEELL